MNNPVAWFEIYVEDMDRAKAFYESVFGVQLAQLDSPIPGMELWAFPMQNDSSPSPAETRKPAGSGLLGLNGVLTYQQR